MKTPEIKNEREPARWGLPETVVAQLPKRLQDFWRRYRHCFWTQTRDQSAHAWDYLSALLRMEKQRNFTEIARHTGQLGQNMQHFMSNSPWSGRAVCTQVQREVGQLPAWPAEGLLVLDESADEKAGEHSAGTGRQYNGRQGKVDVCQVGVFLAYVNAGHWTWVDGELFLPEAWFDASHADLRAPLGIPPARQFMTKVELGWQMIQRVQAAGLPFRAVACDDLYGRANWFRAALARADILYMADVPCDTSVYLTQPEFGVPDTPPEHRGPPYRQPQVLSDTPSYTVAEVGGLPDTCWQTLRVRPTERGFLEAGYAARRVWTMRDGQPTAEWLLMRRDAAGHCYYALSNTPPTATVSDLAQLEAARYFVERAIQDAKSEIGWDEFQAQKYRAWEHQLALTVLASWFIALTKWEWSQQYPRAAEIAQTLGVKVLPGLSFANVRTMLRAAMPLPQLSLQQATALVVEHLINRTRSRKCRLKQKRRLVFHLARAPA